jgi:D-alanyl-D-alanine carboxypeptidase
VKVSDDLRGGTELAGGRIVSAVVAAALVAVVVLGAFLLTRDDGSRAGERAFLVDDFESGSIADWRSVNSGSGSWFVYSDGQTPPDPAHTDPNVPFHVPDPRQGKFAVVTDMDGPGTRILYRDIRLDGHFSLQAIVFYATHAPFSSPETLAHDARKPNQQFRIDLVRPSAPIDSLARDDVLVNLVRTAPNHLPAIQPTHVSVDVSRWAGQTVRLRLAVTDNGGPLRVTVDNIRLVPIGADADGGFELLDTPEPESALDLVVRRMSEAQALAALSTHAAELAREGEFSGAVLVARDGKVLLQDAWGRADRAAGTPNTIDTKFRIGSMNKMFTAVATLQLVEAGKLDLDDPIGEHLRGYPNKEAAAKVTVRHLLTHTGGTGDIFGPEFAEYRLKLRKHGDYVQHFGSRAPAFEPGARFEYSNYGFVLLGALIEAVSGRSYYDYVRENVFRPAGMSSTDSLPESEHVPNRSVGYTRPYPSAAWEPNTDTLPWRGTAAGGGYSTVGDLLRFAQALSSETLISKSMLEEATRPHQPDYGHGFGVQGEGSLRSYGHGGGAPGMNGELRIYPELGYVVASLSNLDPPSASELVEYFALRMPDE